MSRPQLQDQRLVAAVDLLHRVGAASFEMRYSEPEQDDSPVVWIAIITLHEKHPLGANVPPQVAAGLSPLRAAEKLAEQLVDGGRCKHCHRPTVFYADPADHPIPGLCAYQYDPELNTYRRSCEGDQP
ncbi:MAG: hypothetical protein J2P43_01185 [Candidatus Dormibacteraeota bacterium]|nr:hypothetical protein [Candidatus Dormibacteraeota bacterium]